MGLYFFEQKVSFDNHYANRNKYANMSTILRITHKELVSQTEEGESKKVKNERSK
jgi:hypothetical protein